MKKLYPFNIMSLKECRICGKNLKARIVEQKQNVTLCYKCFIAQKRADK